MNTTRRSTSNKVALSLAPLVVMLAVAVICGVFLFVSRLPKPREFPTIDEVRDDFYRQEGHGARGPVYEQVAIFVAMEHREKGRPFAKGDLHWYLGRPAWRTVDNGETVVFWPYSKVGVNDASVIARCHPDGSLIQVSFGETPASIRSGRHLPDEY